MWTKTAQTLKVSVNVLHDDGHKEPKHVVKYIGIQSLYMNCGDEANNEFNL
jgi:hypothetical protein